MLRAAQESFEPINHLGTGGFAQTWLAKIIDPELIDEWGVDMVAIKIPLSKQKERVLRKELELTGSLRLQLDDNEARNIVEYLGFEVFDGKLVMVMKYVNGGSLRDGIGNIGKWKPMECTAAARVIQGILNGLAVLHRRNIVHRDIKPENILMEGETPKIADLGIGRMLKKEEQASTKIGTLFYTSPEVLFDNIGASFNTDIWSLGVTFYEMVCGAFPYGIHQDMPMGRILERITKEDVPLVFPEHLAVPPQLQAVMTKALMRKPSLRYESAEAMLADLNGFFTGGKDAVAVELESIQEILEDPARSSEAERKLNDLKSKFPQDGRCYLHLGDFYNRRGKHNRALAMFREGLTHDPSNALLHWGAAMAYQKRGENAAAAEALKKALALGLDKSNERYARALLKTLEK